MRKIKFVSVTLLASSMLLASCGHEHTFEEKWTTDSESHWHASTCGHDVISGKEAHSWGEWSVKTEPTCVEEGLEERTCSVCGEIEQKPIETVDHSYGSDGICTLCGDYDEEYDADSKVFTTEKLGSLNGEFYCYGFTLNVSKDGATLFDGLNTIELVNNRIKGSVFDTVVTYKDGQNQDYTLCWEQASWDVNDEGFMLPTLKANGSELQFQPSIEKAQGWYTGFGDAHPGNIVYIVQNEFDSMTNYFLGGAAHYSFTNFVYPKSTIWSSSFYEIGGEVLLAISYYFQDDAIAGIPFETYFLYPDENNEKLMLMYPDGSDFGYASSVMMLLDNFTYFNPADCESEYPSWVEGCTFYGLDEESKYVMDFDWNDVTYVEGFDEKGQYINLNGTILRGNSYGITLDNGEAVVEYPACDMSYSKGFPGILNSYSDYVYGEDVISFYGDEFYANDVLATSFKYEIIDHVVYAKAEVNEDVYLISPEEEGIISVKKNGVSSYYLDSWTFGDSFVNDYFDEGLQEFKVDSDHKITTGGQEYQGNLRYDEEYGVILEYDESKFIFTLNEDEDLYAVFDRNNENFLKVLVTQEKIEASIGEFSSGKTDLVVSENVTSITYKGSEYAFYGMSLENDNLYNFYPAFVFVNDQAKVYELVISKSGLDLYEIIDGGLIFEASFIKKADFESIIGEYNYAGKYGKETIKVASDGTLTVDTLNETGDGIIPVDYEYTVLYTENGNVEIDFFVERSQGVAAIPIVFSGLGCAIQDIKYIAKELFDGAGLYGTKDGFVSITDNGSVYYNGQEVKNVSVSGGKITGTFGGLFDSKTIEIALEESKVGVSVAGAEEVTFNKVDVELTLADFVCEPQINVSEQGQDVKITAEGIFYRATGCAEETPWIKVSSYYFGIEEDGTISLKFDTVPAVHNTAVITAPGVVSITAVFAF